MGTPVSQSPTQVEVPVRPEAAEKAPRGGWWGKVPAAYLFLAPALLVLGIFFFLPVAGALVLSFTDFDIYALADLGNARFVGFRNYVALLQTDLFWKALGWFGVGSIDWLGDPTWAMPAIILLAVWKNFGYNMIIFIAGLQNIPGELYEAAGIDGAGGWRQFKHITLPMLAPTFLFVSIITMIGYFQLFAEPYVMTQGGPLNSTLSIVMLMYNEGFKWWNRAWRPASRSSCS